MSFAWPLALLLLLAVPAAPRRVPVAAAAAPRAGRALLDVALVRAALPRRSRWRRHVPVALFLASLAGLAFATARPQMAVEVPLGRTSIILALDVSRSMCATDVEPNRLAVAQEAARTFVEEQVEGTRIGIVAFAGFAELVLPPTTDKDALIEVIDNLTTARGTVIGAATLKALDAIAAVNPDVAPVGVDASTSRIPSRRSRARATCRTSSCCSPTGPTPGASDRSTAAQEAADSRRVRIYTIGFGTTTPTEMVCLPEQLGADVFSEGGFPGGGRTGGGGLDATQFLLHRRADAAGRGRPHRWHLLPRRGRRPAAQTCSPASRGRSSCRPRTGRSASPSPSSGRCWCSGPSASRCCGTARPDGDDGGGRCRHRPPARHIVRRRRRYGPALPR